MGVAVAAAAKAASVGGNDMSQKTGATNWAERDSNDEMKSRMKMSE